MLTEDVLFQTREIRMFLEHIREKDLNYVVRDLCLLGIQVFQERNPTLTHYSRKDVMKCLQNFVEESKFEIYNEFRKYKGILQVTRSQNSSK